MATTRPFAYNTGSTITRTDQVGELAIAYTGQTDRYDLDYGGAKWWMGADEDPGYVIAYRVSATQQPEFWRTDSKTDALFLNLSNYIRRINGDGQTFSDTAAAYTWLTSNGYWSSYSGETYESITGFTVTVNTAFGVGDDAFKFDVSGSTGDYYIDWGDETVEMESTTGRKSHTYTSGGIYQIVISKNATHLVFGDATTDDRMNASKITSLDKWGDTQWTNMYSMFYYAQNMVANYSDSPNMSNVTNMSYMFYQTRAFNGVLNFDTSNVTDMSYMLSYSIFNNDTSSFDTRKVTTMYKMFANNTNFNQSVNHFITSGVTTMYGMFDFASNFNQPLSNWDTSNVTTMSHMFYMSDFAQDLTNFNTSNVVSMDDMFGAGCPFNHDISSFDTRKVTHMSRMFSYNTNFNQPLDHFVTSGVTYMNSMFNGAVSFNQSLGAWDTSNVVDFSNMFAGATAFNNIISGFTINSSAQISGMFNGATVFNQPVDHFSTSNAVSYDNMFRNCPALKETFSGWTFSQEPHMTDMCGGTTDINSPNSYVISGSTTNYDLTLIRIEDQVNNTVSGKQIGFGKSKFGADLVANGTTDGLSGNTLVCSGQSQTFLSDVSVGDIVYITTGGTITNVTNVNSDSTLELGDNICTEERMIFQIHSSDVAKARFSLIDTYEYSNISDGGPRIPDEVRIGTQIWMTRNVDIDLPGSLDYDNDISYRETYGKYYHLDAHGADIEAAYPGWHLPSEAEFNTLVSYVNNNGGDLKEFGTSHWLTNVGGNNRTLFTGLPGGYGHTDTDFRWMGSTGYLMGNKSSFTIDTVLYLYQDSTIIQVASPGSPPYYFNVRLIKD